MTRLLALLMFFALAAGAVRASPRYALVVGMNEGLTDDRPMPALRFAERDARSIRDALVSHAGFDASHIELVTGGDRASVLAAAERLVALRAADRRIYGDLPSLLLVFFSGHGRDGHLLTSGEPFDAKDVDAIRARLGASVMIAIFDTCESADALPKGAVPTANPLDALPSTMLGAAGTIWIASSSRGEVALEDQRGGIFSRHFLDAFVDSPGNLIGRSIGDMFELARARTQRDVERLGLKQTPRMRINIEQTAPLYLSLNTVRSARLMFAAELAGTFFISYDDGTLVERVDKQAGGAIEVAAYAGRVKVYRRRGHEEELPWAEFQLASGQRAFIADLPSTGPPAPDPSIRKKGDVDLLVRVEDGPREPARLGIGWAFEPIAEGRLGAPHQVTLGLWWPLDAWSIAGRVAWGRDAAAFSAWGYEVDEWRLELAFGRRIAAWSWGRFDVEVGVGGGAVHERFDDGGARGGAVGAWRAAGRLGVPVPAAEPWLVLEASAGLGGRWSPSVADDDGSLGFGFGPFAALTLAWAWRQ